MNRKRKHKQDNAPADRPAPSEPVDVHNGIPDCAARTSPLRWALIGLLFVAWVAFLVYCWLGGNPPQK